MNSFLLGASIVTAISTAALALNATPHSSSTSPLPDSCKATATAAGKTVVETAVAAGNFKTLVAAIQAAKLAEALSAKGPFTVFAPSDEAFAKLPKGTLEQLLKPENIETLKAILTYHVVAGDVRAKDVVKLAGAMSLGGQRLTIHAGEDGVRVAGAKVVSTDIACSNGVIHVVDTVLMPATKNLVATAVDAGQFTTLAKALGAAGLVDALSGKGPFTVFAPTDAAFAQLPEGTLESLLRPEHKDQLVAILKYHVVSGRVYSDGLKTGTVDTLGGTKLRIEVDAHGAHIGGASVAKADIETSNGVIHVIDQVLVPAN